MIMNKILLSFLFSIPVIPFLILDFNNLFGWIVLYATYISVFFIREFHSKKITMAVLTVLSVHNLFIFYFSFINLAAMGPDANRFIEEAKMIHDLNALSFSFGADAFVQIISMFFSISGDSLFLFLQINNFIFLLSMILMLKILKEFSLLYSSVYNSLVLLVYGLTPSILIFTTVPLREMIEICVIMAHVYNFILFNNYRRKRHFIISLILLGLLGAFHNGLALLVVIMVPVLLFFRYKQRNLLFNITIVFLSLCVAIFIIPIIANFFSTPATEALLNGNLVSYLQDYRSGGYHSASPRASYGGNISEVNFISLPIFLFKQIYLYFFAPFIWQVSSPIDVVVVFENILRIFLLAGVAKFYSKLHKKGKNKIMQYMIFLIIIVECLWALGTLNWGTGFRHHTLVFPLILVLGGNAWYSKYINHKSRKKFSDRVKIN